jgi:predicted ATPase
MLHQLSGVDSTRKVFFDRGLPDLVGYLRRGRHEVPATLLHSARHYTPLAFIAPPWEEIYVNDAERPQTFSEAVTLGSYVRRAYEELGFEIVELKRESVTARVEHIRSVVDAWHQGRARSSARQASMRSG